MAKATQASIADILAAMPQRRAPGALDRWLSSDPKRSAKFWAVVDAARDLGAGYGAILIGWNAKHEGPDRCPVKHNQVRLAHMERSSDKAHG